MDKKFKWNMFITSFIPLWLSIIVFNIWGIISNIYNNICGDFNFMGITKSILEKNALELISIIIILVINCISIVNINIFLKDKKTLDIKPSGKIIDVKRSNKLSSEFLLAYILPMIAFDFSNLRQTVLFIIYFLVLAILCIRNNNVYTNILLEFKGYKMYECDIECSVLNSKYIYKNSLVISRDDLMMEKNNDILYWDFDNYIYICLGKKGA